MKLRFLYPADPFDARRIDERFAPEAAALLERGHEMSVVNVDALRTGEARLVPPPWLGQRIIYRGWRLPAEDRAALVRLVESKGGVFSADEEPRDRDLLESTDLDELEDEEPVALAS